MPDVRSLFPIFIIFVFFPVEKPFTERSRLSFHFLCQKKSSGALNNLFQSIVFELTISGRLRLRCLIFQMVTDNLSVLSHNDSFF